MIHCFEATAQCGELAEGLARSLVHFERQFWYPLGPTNSFRIEHGDDYTLFFRAMGRAVTFCEFSSREIRGVISVVLRTLRTPSGECLRAAYFCDLKVLANARGGFTAARLLQHAARWAMENVSQAFAVVMGGTAASPARYTGRIGIPEFRELGQLTILRILIPASPIDEAAITLCSTADARAHFARTCGNSYSSSDGVPELRSQMNPCGLTTVTGTACAVLEDTRRAKRLYDQQGNEMTSAHLSSFVFQTPWDAAALIRGAMILCRRQSIPALFVSLAPDQTEPLLAALPAAEVVQAQAAIFGHGLPAEQKWHISSSEI